MHIHVAVLAHLNKSLKSPVNNDKRRPITEGLWAESEHDSLLCGWEVQSSPYLSSLCRQWTRIGRIPDLIRSSMGGLRSLDSNFLQERQQQLHIQHSHQHTNQELQRHTQSKESVDMPSVLPAASPCLWPNNSHYERNGIRRHYGIDLKCKCQQPIMHWALRNVEGEHCVTIVIVCVWLSCSLVCQRRRRGTNHSFWQQRFPRGDQ